MANTFYVLIAKRHLYRTIYSSENDSARNWSIQKLFASLMMSQPDSQMVTGSSHVFEMDWKNKRGFLKASTIYIYTKQEVCSVFVPFLSAAELFNRLDKSWTTLRFPDSRRSAGSADFDRGAEILQTTCVSASSWVGTTWYSSSHGERRRGAWSPPPPCQKISLCVQNGKYIYVGSFLIYLSSFWGNKYSHSIL